MTESRYLIISAAAPTGVITAAAFTDEDRIPNHRTGHEDFGRVCTCAWQLDRHLILPMHIRGCITCNNRSRLVDGNIVWSMFGIIKHHRLIAANQAYHSSRFYQQR